MHQPLAWYLIAAAVLAATANEAPWTLAIDGGSTGSRSYVYSTRGEAVRADVGTRVRPGVSDFATHEQDVEAYIGQLFADAQSKIPQADHART
jgi:hypothetical protein